MKTLIKGLTIGIVLTIALGLVTSPDFKRWTKDRAYDLCVLVVGE